MTTLYRDMSLYTYSTLIVRFIVFLIALLCFISGTSKENWETCELQKNSIWGYKACYDRCFTPVVETAGPCGERPEIDDKVRNIYDYI